MSQLGDLEAGSRHDLRVGISPDAPDESEFRDDGKGAFGYVHSYETSSRYDGPGLRVVLFVSGCLLRCTYCHNPDTWHLKDGTYVSAQQVIDRLGSFAPALRALDGGLTISGGEPMVQLAFTRRILAARQGRWACTRRSKRQAFSAIVPTRGSCPASISCCSTSRARIRKPIARSTGRDLAPTLRFAERLAAIGKPVWVRFTLVPGLTDDPANVERIARFVAPMKNVEWVEVQPFHQLGAFKWKAMQLEYKHADTPTPTPELINRVLEQFRAAGCRAR